MQTLTSKTAILFILSALVTACGGGGGNGGGASVDTNVEADPVLPVVVIDNSLGGAASTKATVTMQELVAADDFLFTNKQSIQVSLSLSEYEEQRAYISVYGDYQQLPSGRYYPDSNSRTIAGTLQQGEFESSFIALNQQATFLVEIWFYDGQDAIQKEITLANNKLSW